MTKEATAIIGRIPADFERATHYEILASHLSRVDVQDFKACIKLAVPSLSQNSTDKDCTRIRRRIVDLAYSINPEFAATIVEFCNADQARKEVQRRLAVLSLKTRMVSNGVDKSISQTDDVVDASWLLSGALRSGRVSTLAPEEIRQYLKIAGSKTLIEAYPIYSWFIENAIVRFSKTDQARTYLRPLFDAISLGAQFSSSFSCEIF